MISRTFALGIGLLSAGAVIFLIAVIFADPWDFLDYFYDTGTGSIIFYCNGWCYLKSVLDFVGAALGAILMLAGAVILIWRLFPYESQ